MITLNQLQEKQEMLRNIIIISNDLQKNAETLSDEQISNYIYKAQSFLEKNNTEQFFVNKRIVNIGTLGKSILLKRKLLSVGTKEQVKQICEKEIKELEESYAVEIVKLKESCSVKIANLEQCHKVDSFLEKSKYKEILPLKKHDFLRNKCLGIKQDSDDEVAQRKYQKENLDKLEESLKMRIKELEESCAVEIVKLEESCAVKIVKVEERYKVELEQRHEIGSDSNFIEIHPMLSTVFAGMAIGAALSSVVVGASIGGFFGAGVYFCVKSLVDYCKKPEFHEEGIEILPCEPQNQNAARAFTDEPQNVARAFNDDKKLDDSGNEVFPTIEMQSTEESFINDKKTNLLVKCIFTGNHIPIEEAIQIDGQWYSIEYFTHEALSIIDGKNPFAIINPITKKEFEKDDLEKIAIYYNTTVENIKKIMNISYIKRTKIYKSLKNEVITANKARNYDKKNDIKEKNHKKQGEEPGAYFKRIKEIIDFDDYEKEEDLIIEARKCHFDKMSEERNKA